MGALLERDLLAECAIANGNDCPSSKRREPEYHRSLQHVLKFLKMHGDGRRAQKSFCVSLLLEAINSIGDAWVWQT